MHPATLSMIRVNDVRAIEHVKGPGGIQRHCATFLRCRPLSLARLPQSGISRPAKTIDTSGGSHP